MIKAYRSKKAKAKLELVEYQEVLSKNDVLVKIDYCGICHSDLHLADGEWGNVFPLVPGHEIVGAIEKVGVDVKRVSNGQRVGIGWQCDSCGECEWCKKGEERLCEKYQPTCMGHHGGFANKVVVNERFAIPLPEKLESAKAAPLFCAGITVYTPLREYAKKGDRVAIIGVGGLGHLALQIAKAMGCYVTAISKSPGKKSDAIKFGADEFLQKPKKRSYDLIINTAQTVVDMKEYILALRPKGTFVQLGISSDKIIIDMDDLISGRKRVAGSSVGHPHLIKELLDFAVKHKIESMVQIIPMKDVNKAIEIVRSNKARYRIVLKN